MIKETPIIFSTPMVQAILEGKKTMTRRIVSELFETPFSEPCGDFLVIENKWLAVDFIDALTRDYDKHVRIKCPYGKPGDLLWVRETWGIYRSHPEGKDNIVFKSELHSVYYPNDSESNGSWKPSIHLKKIHARLWLQIENIRVERLRDISEADAKAEGIMRYAGDNYYFYPCKDLRDDTYVDRAVTSFYSLWKVINGQESWDANPWVWVIEFKELSRTGHPKIPHSSNPPITK